jgi:hypothetical protein
MRCPRIDTIGKLTEDGHQEIHVLETMLGLAIAGCTHYDGAKALARMFRHLAMSAIGVPMPP